MRHKKINVILIVFPYYLPQQDYCIQSIQYTRPEYTRSSRGRETPNGKEIEKIVITKYTTSNYTTVVGNIRLS